MKLYDTRTREVTEVKPIKSGEISMYTCGPTVYRDSHLGNMRSYLMTDWLRRALETQGISVNHVKNITDVGHMRQDVLERGDDKVIAAALAEGTTPQQIAERYTERFMSDERKLNIAPAHHFPRATDHVTDMVAIIERLMEKRYAYEAEGNVYFDVARFPSYGRLSGNTEGRELREGVSVDVDPLKGAQRDFALWKAAEPGRELKWPSPWGEGFPGWHIECSAMSIKYLGERFDIHTGGVDNIFPHHEDEIAQSEGFTDAPVVGTWLHGQHLLADGVKMSKSAGNTFTVGELEQRGIDPLAFRYLCLTARFNNRLNFTFRSLKAAQTGLRRLRDRVWEWEMSPDQAGPDPEALRDWWGRFLERVNDNLDMPKALALTWDVLEADLPRTTRLAIVRGFDRVLGLGLDSVAQLYAVPDDVFSRVEQRAGLRDKAREQVALSSDAESSRAARQAAKAAQELYQQADAARSELTADSYLVEDAPAGTSIRPRFPWDGGDERWESISTSNEVESLLSEPDAVEITIGVVADNHMDDVSRCIQSALRWGRGRSIEVVVVDNGSTDGTEEWLHQIASKDERVRVVHADHVLGKGAANNIVLKQSRGRTIVMLDTSTEVRGDIYGPIEEILGSDDVGVAGPFGLRTGDLHHFHEIEDATLDGDVDAMQLYCFAFRRERLADVGMMRETFRFYRNLDLDYSFHFRDRGYRIVSDSSLPVRRHVHRVWNELGEAEREQMSRKNFRRFLEKWGDRADLLVGDASETDLAVTDDSPEASLQPGT